MVSGENRDVPSDCATTLPKSLNLPYDSCHKAGGGPAGVVLHAKGTMAFWDILRRFWATASDTEDAAVRASANDGFTVLLAPIEGDDGTVGQALTRTLGAVPGLTLRPVSHPGSVDPDEDVPATLARAVHKARALADHGAARCILFGARRGRAVDLWIVPAVLDGDPPGCALMAGDRVTLTVPIQETACLAVVATLAALPLETDAQRARRLDLLREPMADLDGLLQRDSPWLPEDIKPAAALCYAAALAEIGWRANQTPLLEKAVSVQQAALAQARGQPSVPADTGDDAPSVEVAAAQALFGPAQIAAAWARLGDILGDLGKRANDEDKLQRAVACYRKAAAFFAYELLPEEHARVVAQMGRACHRLAHLTGKTTWMRDAVAAYRDACRVWGKGAHPARWAEMQYGIGTLLGQLGEFTGKKDIFERAVAVLTGIMDVWTQEHEPRRWAGLHNNIGACRFAEGKLTGDIPLLRDALEHFNHALGVYDRLGMTRNIHVTQKNIHRVERLIWVQEGKGA